MFEILSNSEYQPAIVLIVTFAVLYTVMCAWYTVTMNKMYGRKEARKSLDKSINMSREVDELCDDIIILRDFLSNIEFDASERDTINRELDRMEIRTFRISSEVHRYRFDNAENEMQFAKRRLNQIWGEIEEGIDLQNKIDTYKIFA